MSLARIFMGSVLSVSLAVTQMSSDKPPPIVPYQHKDLEYMIDENIGEALQADNLSKNEDFGFIMYDLVSNEMLYSFNGSKQFQMASLVKPFVALAYFHRLTDGSLKVRRGDYGRVSLMLGASDNDQTNYFIRRLGGPSAVEKLLRREFPILSKGIIIEKTIPPDGAEYENKATLNDYLELMKLLWNKELPYSSVMLDLMSKTLHSRIIAKNMPADLIFYDKTGTTAMLCGDMAIISGANYKGEPFAYAYIAVIQRATRTNHLGKWTDEKAEVMRMISGTIYKELALRNNMLILAD